VENLIVQLKGKIAAMAALKSNTAPYVAAGVLAVITLLVFFTLRDYGPQSAVRRFNTDIHNHDYTDLQNVTTSDVHKDPNVALLDKALRDLDSLGASSRIVTTDMVSIDKATVLSVFDMTDHHQFFVWVTRKEPNQGWKIDPEQTIYATTAVWRQGPG